MFGGSGHVCASVHVQRTYGGVYFAHDHGKHRNAERYNFGGNYLLGGETKVTYKIVPFSKIKSLYKLIAHTKSNPPYTYVHAHACARVAAYISTQCVYMTCIQTHACMHACMHVCAHTHTHSHTHTHTHIRMHTGGRSQFGSFVSVPDFSEIHCFGVVRLGQICFPVRRISACAFRTRRGSVRLGSARFRVQFRQVPELNGSVRFGSADSVSYSFLPW